MSWGVPVAKLVASPPVSGGRRDQEGARPRRTHLTLKLKMARVKGFREMGESHSLKDGRGSEVLEQLGSQRCHFTALT